MQGGYDLVIGWTNDCKIGMNSVFLFNWKVYKYAKMERDKR